MSFVNQPPCALCNHDQIFFTGFMAGCAFLIMSLHLTREMYTYFKSKESELRQNFAPEEKSSSESDEDSSERVIETPNKGVEEKADEEPTENLCTNDEVALKKDKEISSDDKPSNSTQSIERRKNFAANLFRLDDLHDAPSCEEPSHLYRSNSKYMTMSELEEIGKNRKI
jgi:hypothetical protein